MATAGQIITGSTDSPTADSNVRGTWVAGIGGIVGVICLLTDAPLEVPVLLIPTETMLGFMLFGMWDRFARGKIMERANKPPAP